MLYNSHENDFLNEDNVLFLSHKYGRNISKNMTNFAKIHKLDDYEYVGMDSFETLEYINSLFTKTLKKENKDKNTYKYPIDSNLHMLDISPPDDIYISSRNSIKKREVYLYKRNYDKDTDFKDGLQTFNKKTNPLSTNKYISSESRFY